MPTFSMASPKSSKREVGIIMILIPLLDAPSVDMPWLRVGGDCIITILGLVLSARIENANLRGEPGFGAAVATFLGLHVKPTP